MCAFSVVDSLFLVFQQTSQFANLLLGEFFALHEMGQHRPQRAAEHPSEEGLAGGIDTILFFNRRAVEIGASFLFEAQGAFPDQAVEKCLDGFGVPGGIAERQRLNDLTGGSRRFGPNLLHDFPLRL